MISHKHFLILALVLSNTLLVACSSNTIQLKPKPIATNLYNDQKSLIHDMAENPPDAASNIKRADGFYQQGNMDDALYYYVKSLELDDKNKAVLERIGQIHVKKGNYDLAEAAYNLALRIDKNNAQALEGLGIIQLNTGKQAEADKSLRAAVAIDPKLWQANNGLGLIADKRGDYVSAAQYYQAALKTKPNSPMLLNNLGYSKYLSGNYAEAIPLFDLASKIDAKYEPSWLNLGLVYARQDNDTAALEAFMHVLDEADAYNNLGYIDMINGKTNAANEYFQKAISSSPSYHILANENLKRLRTAEKLL